MRYVLSNERVRDTHATEKKIAKKKTQTERKIEQEMTKDKKNKGKTPQPRNHNF